MPVELSICPACGASVAPNAKYCEWCGSQFKTFNLEISKSKDKSYKTICANYYIPWHKIPFMSEDDIHRTAVADIAKIIVNKLIADKMIDIKSYYDVCIDAMVYVGYLNVVPPNKD